MTAFDIAHYRLFNQGITLANFDNPAQVVFHMGAVQAQDYLGALWSLGLRMKEATQAAIEQAITARSIVRTWSMRGTLHFVATNDVRWMLKFLTPRIIAGNASRYRELELDDETFRRSEKVISKALVGGKQLTRQEIFEALERENISSKGQRGIHILGRLSQEGLLCFGAHLGKQPTFVLLDEWLPPSKDWSIEEALAELTLRYFTGHGPATILDLERWASLKKSEARTGLEMVKSQLRQEKVNGQTYWLPPVGIDELKQEQEIYVLPGFDEYLLGYKDRSAVLEPEHFQKIVPGGNGMFMPTIISNGRVVGSWKREVKKDKLLITPAPFNTLSPAETLTFRVAAERYGHFMNKSIEVN
jgi:hypothetical protein